MQSEFRPRKVNTAVIDICRYNLVKCIKSDVPCSEGYGPANLVTNNFIERSKGFLAERFIKPPVHLTLEFKSEINIEYVAIICSVGAQKSKGLELFSQAISKGSCYESVASGVLPEDKIGFVFHRFNINVKDRFGENYCFRKFKSSRFLSLVNNIKIKIFCTSGASIPALGKIEIWGTPLKNLPLRHDSKTTSQPQTLSSKGQEELDLTAISCKPAEPKIIKPSHLSLVLRKAELDQSFIIPDDFIDPISCEVMVQPIILPSGKIVDSSTIKSHENAELRWGRGPSDPFTGIPFSDSNKPIAASDLKSRIDKFLSDNCNVSELKNMPRTLGTKGTQNQRCEVVVSKLVTNTRPSSVQSHVKNLPTDRCSSSTLPDKFKPLATLKRKHTQIDSVASSTIGLFDDSRNNLFTSSLSASSSVNHIEVGLREKLRCTTTKAHDTFQERMEQSLELALKSTLSKLPKFTSDKTDSVEGACTALCNACQSCENLFSIPCNHFVCRFCLLQVKREKIPTICLLCNCEYKTSDAQKVHTR